MATIIAGPSGAGKSVSMPARVGRRWRQKSSQRRSRASTAKSFYARSVGLWMATCLGSSQRSPKPGVSRPARVGCGRRQTTHQHMKVLPTFLCPLGWAVDGDSTTTTRVPRSTSCFYARSDRCTYMDGVVGEHDSRYRPSIMITRSCADWDRYNSP